MRSRFPAATPTPVRHADRRYDWLLAGMPVAAPLLMAFFLRLVTLDQRPLSPQESGVALAGWNLWRDSSLWLDQPPLLPNLLSILFGAFTAGDLLARLPVALAGALTALVPLLLAPALGRRAALGGSWLLAVSPLLVLSSRTLSGAPVALLAVGLAAAAALRWERAATSAGSGVTHTDSRDSWEHDDVPAMPSPLLATEASRWAALLGFALSMGLGASYLFVPWMAALVLAAVLTWGWKAGRAWVGRWRADWQPLAAGFTTGVIVLDTRLLTTPPGLNAGLIDPLWRWLPGYAGGLDARILALLATTEAPLWLVAGFSAWLVLRGPTATHGRFFLLWLVFSVPLALRAQGPMLDSAIAPLLPAAVLGGAGLAAVWSRAREGLVWRIVAAAAAGWIPVGYLLVAALAWARQRETPPTTELLVAAIAMGLVALLASNWLNRAELQRAGLLLIASVGLFFTLSFIGRLNLRSDEPPPIPGEWALPGLKGVVADVQALARQQPDAPLTIDVDAATWLGWSLRDLRLAPVDATAPALVDFVELTPARVTDSVRAGVVEPVGTSAKWAEDASLRAWWRWTALSENWVTFRASGIIVGRS